jgi:hypothetical protein
VLRDISMGEQEITGFVSAAGQVVSFMGMVWGQIRRKDLAAGIYRINKC